MLRVFSVPVAIRGTPVQQSRRNLWPCPVAPGRSVSRGGRGRGDAWRLCWVHWSMIASGRGVAGAIALEAILYKDVRIGQILKRDIKHRLL